MQLTLSAIPLLVVAWLNLAIGLYAYRRNPNSQADRAFALMASTAALWTVTLGISGTAVNGTDYDNGAGGAIPLNVNIPAGQSSATITVRPINDLTYERNETVIITIQNGPGYTPGSPKTGKVTIIDNDLRRP